jgi:succinate-acetate transporter protein
MEPEKNTAKDGMRIANTTANPAPLGVQAFAPLRVLAIGMTTILSNLYKEQVIRRMK